MMRFLALATVIVIPAMTVACPWQRHCCQPRPVVIYRTCIPQPPIVRVVEAPSRPLEPRLDPDLEKWVTIKGRIVWDKAKYGEAPKQVPLVATKDLEVAKRDPAFLTEDWVVNSKNLGIQNVVVWVVPEPTREIDIAAMNKAMAEGRSYKFASFAPNEIHPAQREPAQSRVHLTIPFLRFHPHVLAAREGQDLYVSNQSQAPHSPKTMARINQLLNPPVHAGNYRFMGNLKAERFPIEVSCSVHPWMKAYIRVFDHPYFAVTDGDGNFAIKDVPRMQGKVRLFIWQENGLHRGAKGRFGQPIELTLGTTDLKEIKFETGSTR